MQIKSSGEALTRLKLHIDYLADNDLRNELNDCLIILAMDHRELQILRNKMK